MSNNKGTFASLSIRPDNSTEAEPEIHETAAGAVINESGLGVGVVDSDGNATHRRQMSINLTASPAQQDVNTATKQYNLRARELQSMLKPDGSLKNPERDYHRAEVLRNRMASIADNIGLQIDHHKARGTDNKLNPAPASGGTVSVSTGDLAEYMASLPEDDPLRIKYDRQNAAALRRKYRI